MFSHEVMPGSLQHRVLHYSTLHCHSPSPRVCLNSCPLSQWCHSNHLTFCGPLFFLFSIFSSIRAICNELALWPKCWSFSISPFNEYSGLNLLRIDWFDLLAAQGPLKSVFQHHSSKASILWHSVHDWWKNHSFD